MIKHTGLVRILNMLFRCVQIEDHTSVSGPLNREAAKNAQSSTIGVGQSLLIRAIYQNSLSAHLTHATIIGNLKNKIDR